MNLDDDVRQKTGSTHGMSDEYRDKTRKVSENIGKVAANIEDADIDTDECEAMVTGWDAERSYDGACEEISVYVYIQPKENTGDDNE